MAAAAGDVEDPRATTVVQVAAGEAHSLALTGADHFSFAGGIWYFESGYLCAMNFLAEKSASL